RLHDHHAFGMNVPAQLGFAFNIRKFPVTDVYYATDTRRLAECTRVPRKLDDRQGVDLTDTLAFGFDQDLLQQNFILHTVSKVTFTPLALGKHLRVLLTSKRPFTADDSHFTQL